MTLSVFSINVHNVFHNVCVCFGLHKHPCNSAGNPHPPPTVGTQSLGSGTSSSSHVVGGAVWGGNSSYRPLPSSLCIVGVGWAAPHAPLHLHWALWILSGRVGTGVQFERQSNPIHENPWLIWIDEFECNRCLVIVWPFEWRGMFIDCLGHWCFGHRVWQ